MNTYQSTPDYYRDFIEHGWAKDAAAKVHKYVERWRGKNGKWYYSYKSKAQEQIAKTKRALAGVDAKTITDKRDSWGKARGLITMNIKKRTDNGKANSKSKVNPSNSGTKWHDGYSNKNIKTTTGYKVKKNGNVTSRGYSGSQGSGESKRQRNLGTRRRYDVRESANTHHDSYKRLASAYYRTNNEKAKSQVRDSWEKNKKAAKLSGVYGRGIERGATNAWDVDRNLTARGYGSSGEWKYVVNQNNKATSKSVNRKRNTSANNKRHVQKNSVVITKNGKRVTRSRAKKTKYVN